MKTKAIYFSIVLSSALTRIAFAQFGGGVPPPPGVGGGITPPPNVDLSVSRFFQILEQIFNFLFWILIALAVFFVLFAAFKYLTAAGEPEKVKEANKQLVFAAVAVIIGLVARGVPNLICGFVDNCSLEPF